MDCDNYATCKNYNNNRKEIQFDNVAIIDYRLLGIIQNKKTNFSTQFTSIILRSAIYLF